MPRFDRHSDDREILAFLHDVADAAADTLDEIADWSMTGERDGQYVADVDVDDVVVDLCVAAGFVVLSEESGGAESAWPLQDDSLLIVVDPIDGSTNASRDLPWYSTSLCVVDADGPRVALVAEQSGSETRYGAIRGRGANVDGMSMTVVPRRDLGQAVVGVNGVPPVSHPWWQVRTLGAASLDMSLVARGGLDGWCDLHGHGIWDYIAALLICREAGALVEDAEGRDLLTFDLTARRRPLVANSPEVMASLRAVAGRR